MSEYIITDKQLKTATEAYLGHELSRPITEVFISGDKLPEIVRCCDCKYWRRFYPESEQRFGTCRAWRYTTRFDGYCHNASKSDGERQGE